MKTNTINMRLLGIIVIAFILNITGINAQSWDYANFTDGTDISINNACIDAADNVYTYGNDPGYTRVMRRFDASGNLNWTKDVTSLIDYPGNGTQNAGIGGIEYHNSNVYLVGKKSNDGVIIKSGELSTDTPAPWDNLISPDNNEIYDIKVKNDHIYIVGYFSNSLSFFDGTNMTSTGGSGTFIAKYNISPKQLVWAKKVVSSNFITGYNIDVDNSENVYITGHFNGSATFYNGGLPYTFTSSATGSSNQGDSFLAKFNSNGDFDTTFSLKTDPYTSDGNYRRSYDVNVSDTNNAVYWAEYVKVMAYEASGSGNYLWTKTLPNGSKPWDIETNSCGDVYVTGQAGAPVSRNSDDNKAPCGGDFFGISLDATSGLTNWPENSTSCSSIGSEVLIDSNNKEIFVGSYYSSGGTQPLIIGSFSSGNSKGYFISRYDDSAVNNCCDTTIDLGSDQTVCADGSFPTLDISSQISGSPTITWTLNGNTVQSGGNTLSTSTYGTYAVSVFYSQSCIAYGSMLVNDHGCCDQEVNIGADITMCAGDPFPTLDITGQISGFTSILWYHNGNAFPQPFNPETVGTIGAGTYNVVVSYNDGCTTSDTMVLTVDEDCDPDCNVKPNFKIKKLKCAISLVNLSSAFNGGQIIGYLWDFGDGTTSTEVNPTHTYQAGGSYIITLSVYGIDSNGDCCVKQISREIYIAQSCIPKCVMKPSFSVTSVGNGVAMFTSTSVTNGFTSIVGYEWTIDGVVVSNDPYFAQPFNGGYVCLVIYGLTNKGDCCMDRVCREVPPSHQSEQEEKVIKIYPNPTKDSFKIDLNTMDVNAVQELSIFDMYGRQVLKNSNVKSIEEINTSSWPIGVYICQIKTVDRIITKKIIKK